MDIKGRVQRWGADEGANERKPIMSKVRFLTSTGRGMRVNIAKAALAAGNAVMATGITKERHQ
jgi:hypothetical protein